MGIHEKLHNQNPSPVMHNNAVDHTSSTNPHQRVGIRPLLAEPLPCVENQMLNLERSNKGFEKIDKPPHSNPLASSNKNRGVSEPMTKFEQ